MFFIDEQTSFEVLSKLIKDNYRLWGGSFNPFVPVSENNIRSGYEDILGACDPDYIFYSITIDLEKLKFQCPKYHPKAFIQLDENGRNNFHGTYSGYMLAPELSNEMWFERKNSIINLYPGLKDATISFYELSFGFSQRYIEDNTATGGLDIIDIVDENFADIHKIMQAEKPIFTSLLSTRYHFSTLISPNNSWLANSFQLIIYEENSYFDELVYFWNRKLYQNQDNKLKQLIMSRNQLSLLIEDSYFEVFLHGLLFGEKVYLWSTCILKDELNRIAVQVQNKFKQVQVHVSDDGFPYEMMRYVFISENERPFEKAPVYANSQYLILQPPLFKHSFPKFIGKFAYDLTMIKETQPLPNSVRFPYFTSTHHLVTKHPSRINMFNNLSLMVSENDRGVDIKVPEDIEILRGRLISRFEFGEYINIMSHPYISAAGLKLDAFIGMFEGNWHYIEELIGDPFWLNLIMGRSDFKKDYQLELVKQIDGVAARYHKQLIASNIGGSSGAFSHKDIENELRRYYFSYVEEIKRKFAADDYYLEDDALECLLEKSIGEDIILHVDSTLQFLVEIGALSIGMKVKCNNCGSNSWYPLAQLNAKMDCKGCFKTIIPSVTGHLYYRFNEILVNNIKAHSNTKSFDGNYVVLKTLIYLKDSSRRMPSNFSYAPSVDISLETENGQINTDIDILAIVDGKMIIGEAKASADEFKTNVINNLILAGNLIKPDQIILAYIDGGNIEDKIRKVQDGLTDLSCEVLGYQVSEPWHRFGRIFGCQ